MSARRRAFAVAAVLAVFAATPAAGADPGREACAGYVGLTFDDGPGATTADLLDALRENGLRATMFNQGDHADAHPSLVAEQVEAGMWVGNHSYTHPRMTQLTES